jgi:hypothetical protein
MTGEDQKVEKPDDKPRKSRKRRLFKSVVGTEAREPREIERQF